MKTPGRAVFAANSASPENGGRTPIHKIRVLVVDDSPVVCELLRRILDAQPDMEVIATAPDPLAAREIIKATDPDVMTLDIELPRMDGLDFLERVMRLRPMPVVMLSRLTQRGADITLRALELGAVDFVSKPKGNIEAGLLACGEEIASKIRTAHAARARILRMAQHGRGLQVTQEPDEALSLLYPRMAQEKLVLIGASTGGTEALRTILKRLPEQMPPILIAQHMPAGFTQNFADRLNDLCRLHVKQAVHGERILPGHAYVAPGDRHLLLSRSGTHFLCNCPDTDPVNHHRPSVELLFDSGARLAAHQVVGIMLTGMGRDGAAAMKRLRDNGAYNIVQDEATSVVFGMPGQAVALGAAHEVVPLDKVADRLVAYLNAAGEDEGA